MSIQTDAADIHHVTETCTSIDHEKKTSCCVSVCPRPLVSSSKHWFKNLNLTDLERWTRCIFSLSEIHLARQTSYPLRFNNALCTDKAHHLMAECQQTDERPQISRSHARFAFLMQHVWVHHRFNKREGFLLRRLAVENIANHWTNSTIESAGTLARKNVFQAVKKCTRLMPLPDGEKEISRGLKNCRTLCDYLLPFHYCRFSNSVQLGLPINARLFHPKPLHKIGGADGTSSSA